MKKPYNLNWIKNIEVQRRATDWASKNLLDKPQLEAIKAQYQTHFYRPNFFVKIGLFLFAIIASAFFMGFISIFLTDSNITDRGFAMISFLFAGFFIFFLERQIKLLKFFHSGVDNALLYISIALLFVPLFLLFNDLKIWQYSLVLFILLSIATIRYADILTAAGSFLALFVTLANFLMNFSAGTLILPFAVMLMAACIYFAVRKNTGIYYADCCKIIEILSFAAFYLGGNYLIVREGNALLNNSVRPISLQIPFAPVFYLFTIVIPFAYIVTGVRKKDRILLNTGLLAMAFSMVSFGYYFSPFTTAQHIFVSGLALILFSAALIRYLHRPKLGISDEPEKRNIPDELKSILIAQTLGQDPETKGINFGGGNFGGGGAGEVY
ncbi:hypothetical protein [Dyadobacter sediminis]|uniref:DUF2157 domain-containing protein n=1 Tax=Dyadobacter sediminis TaxID=1493691 RepID=A0A5R9KFS4_9BACT|nr:hypothetical protein [Dyadobacter sediminis]TLU94908.1 hypothetical protein FEM55_11900 [Dyadobacter sediminis]GGB86953.1 hypothetical protein GCM10011325_13120 [Dyadobacter sediminis]